MSGRSALPLRFRVVFACAVVIAVNALAMATPVAASVNFVSSFNSYGAGTNLFNQPLDVAVSAAGILVMIAAAWVLDRVASVPDLFVDGVSVEPASTAIGPGKV